MIRIIADDKIPYLKGALEPFAKVTYLPGNQINNNAIRKSDALLIRTRTKCDSDLLAGSTVKYIGTATIGYDHIDTGFCNTNNIKWSNAPGCNSSSVMQYIAAALMRISSESGSSLRDKTLGIIGVGNVGTKVRALAVALGMNVILNDPPRGRKEKKELFLPLEQLLAESDIITLHVPLNLDGQDKTLHLFDREILGRVKKGCWLINSSRGEVVETEALKEAIGKDRLSGVIIDTWEGEPEIDIPLMHMAFLATPHIAGYSADGKANGTSMIVNDLCAFFKIKLSKWYPSEIPSPPEPLITIDCNGKSDEEIIRKSIFHTYNIVEDDIRLRIDQSRFEKERETYPLRREFTSYSVLLKGGNEQVRKTIDSLGFKLAD